MSTAVVNKEKPSRRSGAKIMASLIALLGSLSIIIVLAVINGSIGFVCAMGVTVSGAVGIAKVLGEDIALSYFPSIKYSCLVSFFNCVYFLLFCHFPFLLVIRIVYSIKIQFKSQVFSSF